MLRRWRAGRPLFARAGHAVDSKLHRRRKEWETKAFPRASTQEPSRLPRRGRRGGWMRDPSLGVARLDGSNAAQRAWWQERAGELDDTYADQLRETQGDGAGQGRSMQELLDRHLSERDALSVQLPAADDFRLPHIRRLARTAKPNVVHEATSEGPPLRAAPEPEAPAFLDESEKQRRRRRGRFLGSRLREESSARAHIYDEAGQGVPVHEVVARARPSALEADDSGDEGAGRHPSGPSRGRRSARGRRAGAADGERAEAPSEEHEGDPEDLMQPLRYTSLGALWSQHGASWAEFNRCVVPSAFPAAVSENGYVGATLETYEHTRQRACLFDVSYKVGLRVTGSDREFVADQFLTCNLGAMRPGDVQFACILDNKGLILDDAFVYLTDDSIEILASGCHARQVEEFLGQYVFYVRRSGADVALSASHRTAAVALQGPRAPEALAGCLARLSEEVGPVGLEAVGAEETSLPAEALEAMPYMSALVLRRRGGGGREGDGDDVVVLRAGTTGEDGFELLAPPGGLLESLVASLLESELVRPAGIYCLDVLRMEAGLPRMGSDIPSGRITPIRASLVWLLDQSKMRNHLMFGWEKMFFQLAKGPRFKRVGLLLDGPAHAGCRLLSNPHRQPIGEITSTAWSPQLRSRIAMAYVRPEYAKVHTHVLATVPYNLPTWKMRSKAVKHWIKCGPLRSAYRRLVAACVAPLPFVPHRYPEPERQRRAAARLRRFSPQEVRQAPARQEDAGAAARSAEPRGRGRGAAEPPPRFPPPDPAAASARASDLTAS